MKASIFCDIKQRSPVKFNISFGGIYHLHLQGRRISQELLLCLLQREYSQTTALRRPKRLHPMPCNTTASSLVPSTDIVTRVRAR
jgi:hypothetical protein